jgi:hypothetical protein
MYELIYGRHGRHRQPILAPRIHLDGNVQGQLEGCDCHTRMPLIFREWERLLEQCPLRPERIEMEQ